MIQISHLILNLELVVLQSMMPTSLYLTKSLRKFKVLQQLVICPDDNGLVSIHEIVRPFFQGGDDCQHFFVVDLVISLSRKHHP